MEEGGKCQAGSSVYSWRVGAGVIGSNGSRMGRSRVGKVQWSIGPGAGLCAVLRGRITGNGSIDEEAFWSWGGE